MRHKALAAPDDEWNLAVMRFADTVRGDLAYLRPRVLRCGRLVPHVDGLNGPDLAVIVDAAPRSNALEAAREIALAAARAIFSGLCGARVVVASGAEDRAACRLAGAMQRGPMSKQEIAVVEPVDDLPALLPEELARARQYAAASKAASTRDKYERGWSDFRAWCHARGHEALPADPVVVAAYLSFEADRGMSPSAIQVKLAAIAWVHKRAGHQPPQRTEQGVAISDVMGDIRREHGTPPVRKAAADGDIVRDVLQAITGDGLREARDRALLAFGMASAMRRSELVALEVEDIARDQRGLRVTIRHSKTDQDGKGAVIAVPEGRRLRPVARLREWTERAGITEGPLFRRVSNDGRRVLGEPMSDRAVARVVQQRVAAAGLDPADFAGHSLRAGFLTSAARAGASIFKMREVSRHKTVQKVFSECRSTKFMSAPSALP